MSVPLVDPSSIVPVAVLVASFMGSAHCVSMCGGLVAASARTRLEWVAYQLGRLFGYLLLGTGAGYLGSKVFSEAQVPALSALSWVATVVLAFLFILGGIRLWRGQTPHFSFVPARMLQWFFKMGGKNSAAAGLFTAFLPCGWLHGFVLGALATRSAVHGGMFLFLFWLGSLPALGLAPWLLQRVLKPLAVRSPKIAGVILMLVGFYSIGMKAWPISSATNPVKTEAEHHSHCH